LAVDIVGPWLGYWMLMASTLTNVGMFEAEMSSDAWQVAGMAEKGMIPKVFAARSKYESPHYGVLLSLVGVLFITVMDFTSVIDLLNLLFCFSQAIEFVAYLKLKAEYVFCSMFLLLSLLDVPVSLLSINCPACMP
jgi:L-asparagine transporter-like permease